jgi:hypothetical protein
VRDSSGEGVGKEKDSARMLTDDSIGAEEGRRGELDGR